MRRFIRTLSLSVLAVASTSAAFAKPSESIGASAGVLSRVIIAKFEWALRTSEAAPSGWCPVLPVTRGDMNCDGRLDNFDIDPFTLALVSADAYKEQYPDCDIQRGDINRDGRVNLFDLDPFIALLASTWGGTSAPTPASAGGAIEGQAESVVPLAVVPGGAGGTLDGSAVDWRVNRTETRGDMNCDGRIDNFDIDPFTLALVNADAYKEQYPNCDVTRADINGDGRVNLFDLDPFIELLLKHGAP